MAFCVFEFFPEIESLSELAVLTQNACGALWISEQIRIADRFLEFGKAIAAFGNEGLVIHGAGVKPEMRECGNAEMRGI